MTEFAGILTQSAASLLGLSVPSDHALFGACELVLFFSLACWILSITLKNYSIVDRLWSLLPVIYVWYFVFIGHAEARNVSVLTQDLSLVDFLMYNKRLALMGVLSFLWGVRLTQNYARKGGYALHAEDYRWVVVRRELNNEFLYQLLNLVFTSFLQNVLLFLIAFPAYFALRSAAPLTALDALAAALFLLCFATETVADAQQWRFYEARSAARASLFNSGGGDGGDSGDGASASPAQRRWAADLRRGFSSTGLFAWSRHPNFCAEVSLWWSFAGLAAAAALAPAAAPEYPHSLCLLAAHGTLAAAHPLALPFAGAAALTLLFHASTGLTERLSAAKYPAYAVYQRAVPRLLPLPLATDPFPVDAAKRA